MHTREAQPLFPFPCARLIEAVTWIQASLINPEAEAAMKYLCLGYHERQAWEALSDAQRRALAEECRDFDQVLRQHGYYLDGKIVDLQASAITLRFADGKVCVTDGPVAETRQTLGGVLLLNARDLNHAIQLMSQLPSMRAGGSLEIRPIQERNEAESLT
jgi:hypothetical protein